MTDEEVPLHRSYRGPHRVCAFLRQVRRRNNMSLSRLEAEHGLSAVVIGAYERGDRNPPLWKLEAALNIFGYRLDVVPLDDNAARLPTEDVVATLRLLADFLAERGEKDVDLLALSGAATSS